MVDIWDDFKGKGSYEKLIKSINKPSYSGGIIKPYSHRGKRIAEILKDDISKTTHETVHLRNLKSPLAIFEDVVLEKLSYRQIQISESALLTLQLFVETLMICFFEVGVGMVNNSNRSTLTEKDLLDIKLTLNEHVLNKYEYIKG